MMKIKILSKNKKQIINFLKNNIYKFNKQINKRYNYWGYR